MKSFVFIIYYSVLSLTGQFEENNRKQITQVSIDFQSYWIQFTTCIKTNNYNNIKGLISPKVTVEGREDIDPKYKIGVDKIEKVLKFSFNTGGLTEKDNFDNQISNADIFKLSLDQLIKYEEIEFSEKFIIIGDYTFNKVSGKWLLVEINTDTKRLKNNL